MDKPERLIERIRKYLKNKGITPYVFENNIEVANGYLKKQGAGKGTVGSDTLAKIHKQYPTLNILWLLTGEGEMEISDSNLRIQNEQLKMSETLIESIKQQNATLQSSNTDKDKIIGMLEEKLKDSKTKGK